MTTKPEKWKQRWRTPKNVLEWERWALDGPFDLDPATDPDNPTGARQILTREDNALETPWPSGQRLHLNPPFLKLAPFAKLAADWLNIGGRQGVFIGSYSLEASWADALSGVVNFTCSRPRICPSPRLMWPRILCPSPRLMFDLPPDAPPDAKTPGGYPATIWVFCDRPTYELHDAWCRIVGGRVTVYEPS